jgi:hypothetical protein
VNVEVGPQDFVLQNEPTAGPVAQEWLFYLWASLPGHQGAFLESRSRPLHLAREFYNSNKASRWPGPIRRCQFERIPEVEIGSSFQHRNAARKTMDPALSVYLSTRMG